MYEEHPFGEFVPSGAKYLFLGSFVAAKLAGSGWFYGSSRNQFWPILSQVYQKELDTQPKQQKHLAKTKFAMADIIRACKRLNGSSLDTNLKNLVLNHDGLGKLFGQNDIKSVYFTSRFVENAYKRNFKELIAKYPQINYLTLPSPSPRYAAMHFDDKVKVYKKLLPL